MRILRNNLIEVPKVRQVYEYDCGAAVTQSILGYFGIDVREDKLIKLAKTNTFGTDVLGIERVFKTYKLKTRSSVMTLREVKEYLDRRIPVILLLQAWTENKKVDWENNWSDGHYAIAIGYDKKHIFFQDPYSLFISYLTFEAFMERWHGTRFPGKKIHNFGIIAQGKKPKYDLQTAVSME